MVIFCCLRFLDARERVVTFLFLFLRANGCRCDDCGCGDCDWCACIGKDDCGYMCGDVFFILTKVWRDRLPIDFDTIGRSSCRRVVQEWKTLILIIFVCQDQTSKWYSTVRVEIVMVLITIQ